MKKHLSMAVLVLFIAAQSFASITYLNRATPGTMLNSGKYNQNLTWIEDKFDNGIVNADMDTAAIRHTNTLGTVPTSGDTNSHGSILEGFYLDTSPAVAYTEDTIVTGLSYTPVWVQFMVISDTNARAWTVRRTDTEIVWKSDCCTVPFRIIAW